MARKKKSAETAAMEKVLAEVHAADPHKRYILRLHVAGITPRSEQAIRNVTALCEKHLAGKYELEVIDLYQNPVLAKGEQIIAAPTLIKELPLPLRRLIGNMSQEEKFLVGLDLKPVED